MNEVLTITATLPAWLPNHSSFDRVMTLISTGKHDQAADQLCLSLSKMDQGEDPWTRFGTAEVTITLLPREQVTSDQIKCLNAVLQAERAQSQMRQNTILDRISKLQALTFEPAEEARTVDA